MLTSAIFKDFKGVPHLAGTQIIKRHKGKFKFATDKPNVIVGPNGAGKSALMQALAIRFLAWYTSESSLDNHYVMEREHEALWAEKGWRFEHNWEFMPGMTCETDNAATLFYRPGHIPGNETSVTHAMMTGYFEEARSFDKMVSNKSSGQQSQALLARIESVLAGEIDGPNKYLVKNWRFGTEPTDMTKRGYCADWEYWGEHLKKHFLDAGAGVPLILMDEPEQSLDARAELRLWSKVVSADCSRVQVIVATHSLYPLMHPERFNIIEAVPGYIDEVLKLMA